MPNVIWRKLTFWSTFCPNHFNRWAIHWWGKKRIHTKQNWKCFYKSPFSKRFSEQVERLSLQNEDIEENIENLESTINEKIGYLAYQEAKLCEIENNKEKLRAAAKRLDLLKQVCKPISDNLLLGDLLWLSLHTEMETMKYILQNVSTAHYEEENKQCARNLVRKWLKL